MWKNSCRLCVVTLSRIEVRRHEAAYVRRDVLAKESQNRKQGLQLERSKA